MKFSNFVESQACSQFYADKQMISVIILKSGDTLALNMIINTA